jgi:hypothetical protein
VDRPREPLPTRVEATPALAPAYHDALERGLAALELDLTDDARVAIEGHARLLLAWTGAINLTAIRDHAAVALVHVVDSLSAVPLLRSAGVDRFIDSDPAEGIGVPDRGSARARALLRAHPQKATFLSAAATGGTRGS